MLPFRDSPDEFGDHLAGAGLGGIVDEQADFVFGAGQEVALAGADFALGDAADERAFAAADADVGPERRVDPRAGGAFDGGIFAGSYAVTGGVDKVVPVELHIRGSPPTPTDLLKGLLALLEPVNQKQA